MVSEMWVGSVLGRGDPIGAGYVGVEVVRGRDRAKCKGGWFGPKNQKPSHWGSVLASEMQVGLILGRGDPIGAGYAGVEVVRGRDRVRHKGGLVWAAKPSPTAAVAAVATSRASVCVRLLAHACLRRARSCLPRHFTFIYLDRIVSINKL